MMTKFISSVLTVLAFVLLLNSCAVYKPAERNTSAQLLPQKFSLYSSKAPAPEKWWHAFGSAELNTLQELALKDNLAIAEAGSRFDQALATAVKQGAARWPEISLEGGASYTRTREPNSAGERTTRSYEAGIAASYELDLWGRVKSVTESARLDFRASAEDYSTAAMTIASETALTWFEIISVSRKLKVLQEQLRTNTTMAELTEMRYRLGVSTALDVFQQRQTLAAVKTKFPLLRADLSELKNSLALLLGRISLEQLKIETAVLPPMPPVPGTGIPADLLARRPDIRKAGLQLRSADWLVSAAKADRLPAVRLTASYQYGSEQPAQLFDNWIANLAASLTGPIFRGGYLKAEVKRTESAAREKLASYKKTVITAFHEVENALDREHHYQDYLKALKEQLHSAKTTYREAIEFYRKGATDYINVLNALNTMQSLEISYIDAELNYYKNRVSLYRALGGTWAAAKKETRKRSAIINDNK